SDEDRIHRGYSLPSREPIPLRISIVQGVHSTLLGSRLFFFLYFKLPYVGPWLQEESIPRSEDRDLQASLAGAAFQKDQLERPTVRRVHRRPAQSWTSSKKRLRLRDRQLQRAWRAVLTAGCSDTVGCQSATASEVRRSVAYQHDSAPYEPAPRWRQRAGECECREEWLREEGGEEEQPNTTTHARRGWQKISDLLQAVNDRARSRRWFRLDSPGERLEFVTSPPRRCRRQVLCVVYVYALECPVGLAYPLYGGTSSPILT
ncbi:hypothetical protein BV25DRAFT_1896621, partial [Artomyces pyxidatus]